MPNNEGVSIVKKSSSIAVQSLLLGMHLAANSKMLSMLSNHETGASSVVSTFQTVIIGTAGGFLQATGLEIGSAIAKNKFQKAGHLAKSSFILALGLGSLSTGLMLISPFVFKYVSSEEASKIATDFFKGYAAAGIPSMLVLSSPQIAFHAGEWYLPIASGAIFYIPAGILSYFLAFPGEMGAVGIGLGGSIGGWLSTFFFQSWLYQKKYNEYQLYNLPVNNFKKNLCKLLTTGFQLSVQRLTEWGNLFTITSVIGALADPKYLSATPPAIQANAIFGLSMQGLAQATAMLILRNKAKIKSAIESEQWTEALEWHKKNVSILAINNSLGALFGIAAAVLIYGVRKPFSTFFTSPETTNEVKEIAETFLWINMIGGMSDAVRIISLGSLRAWKDIFVPTLWCLASMTGLGVFLGDQLRRNTNDDWNYMFIMRDATISLAALKMVWDCYKHLQKDKQSMLAIASQEDASLEESNHSSKTQSKSRALLFVFGNKTKEENSPLLNQAKQKPSGLRCAIL